MDTLSQSVITVHACSVALTHTHTKRAIHTVDIPKSQVL